MNICVQWNRFNDEQINLNVVNWEGCAGDVSEKMRWRRKKHFRLWMSMTGDAWWFNDLPIKFLSWSFVAWWCWLFIVHLSNHKLFYKFWGRAIPIVHHYDQEHGRLSHKHEQRGKGIGLLSVGPILSFMSTWGCYWNFYSPHLFLF